MTSAIFQVTRLTATAKLPARASEHASCLDLYADMAGVFAPGECLRVRTGIAMAVPPGFEGQVRSRSGLAAKNGVVVANSPGTIDADYRGEVSVLLINHGQEPFEFKHGDRIAQLAICRVEMCEATEVESLSETARGDGGFESIKLKGGVFEPVQEIAAIKALREAFGPKVPLRHDPNALWTVETAIKWGRELEGLLEYWEDPVRGQAGMAEVRRAVKLPLATNMCTTSFADFPGSIATGSEDIILTDHHFWGGLRASMELAAHCRTFGRGVSMHSNNHAGISLAAMTHLGAAMPNLSYALDTHYPWQWEDIIVGGRMKIEDGSVALPKGPGLGVELDRDALARAHETYKRVGLTERNDEPEMQKKVPGWKFKQTRW